MRFIELIDEKNRRWLVATDKITSVRDRAPHGCVVRVEGVAFDIETDEPYDGLSNRITRDADDVSGEKARAAARAAIEEYERAIR